MALSVADSPLYLVLALGRRKSVSAEMGVLNSRHEDILNLSTEVTLVVRDLGPEDLSLGTSASCGLTDAC